MSPVETVLFWMAVWVYGLGFVAGLQGLVFRKEKSVTVGWYLFLAGLASHTGAIIARWVATGHFPVQGTFENSLLGAWFIALLFLLLRSWSSRLQVIGGLVIPVIVLMLGHGAMESTALEPLSPPYKSNWLWFHVFFAWIAYGAFCVSAGLGVLYLLKEKKGDSGFYQRLPSIEVMSELTLKMIMFGFIALTVEVGAGAIWAHGLWGRYWGWDPIETWSLITWLVYGAYVHLGVTMGWKGRRMAWIAILALFVVFITFGGLGYLGGVHTPILVE